jgi:hypothetical protein
MALIVKDRVKETTTTTGTGTITLAGSPTGFRTFADIGNGNTTYYCISGGLQFEVGIGTYTASGTTLSRDTVLSNSLGTTAKIDFSAGSKDVLVTYPSDKAVLGYPSSGIPNSTGSAWGTSYGVTGTGSVVLSTSPTFGSNTGFGVAPITWSGTYRTIQVGYGGAISNVNSSQSEMSISSNLKNTATYYKYVNNGFATRYYQVDGVHHWAADTLNGDGIADGNATMQDVMTVDNFGNLIVTGRINGQSADVQTLNSPTGFLSVNTGGIGSTYIGATGSTYTTLLDDDFIKLTSLTPSQSVFTDASKNLVSKATTGTGNVVLSASPTITGTLTAATITTSADATINTVKVGLGTGSGNIYNLAVGQGVLGLNTSGSDNLGFGTNALRDNTTGSNNSAFGSSVLIKNNGSYNTGFARGALAENTTGGYNTAVGSFSASNNISGSENTAIGFNSLSANTTASYNVGIGGLAGYGLTSGGDNVVVGHDAFEKATTGIRNIVLGRQAAKFLANGTTSLNPSNSIYIGYQTLGNTSTESNAIVIGNQGQSLGSNTTVIGNSSTTQTKVFGVIQSTTYTVGTLPSASTVGVGARAFVTDALAPVFGMPLGTGTGAVPVPVYSTGSAWNVG